MRKLIISAVLLFLIALAGCSADAAPRPHEPQTLWVLAPPEPPWPTPLPTPTPTPTPAPTPAPLWSSADSSPPEESQDNEHDNDENIMTEAVPPPARPMIALTFDDGPSRYTDIILDVLAAHGARASFCVLGYRVGIWTNQMLRMVEDGHEIIGHSWAHTDMTTQTREQIAAELLDTEEAIYAFTGTRVPLFRPPFGAVNANVEEVAAELGFGILRWSVDPQDWRAENQCVDYLYNFIIAQARDGAIVVLHDIFYTTARAMELVVPRLIADGFALVTASEVLTSYYAAEIVPGEIYRGARAW